MSFRIRSAIVYAVSALLIILEYRVNDVDEPMNVYFLTDWGLFILFSAGVAGAFDYSRLLDQTEKWLIAGIMLGASLGLLILVLRYFFLVLLVYLDVIHPISGDFDTLLKFVFVFLVLTFGDLFQEGGIFVLLAMFNMTWLLMLQRKRSRAAD